MKKFLLYISIAFAITMVSPVYSQENRQNETRRDNREDDSRRDRYDEGRKHRSIKGELMYKLEKLEKDFSMRMGRRDRIELQRQIDEMRELIRRLPSEDRYTPEPEPIPLPMPDVEFQQLLGSVKNEHFSDGKLKVIQSAVRYNFFTVDQTLALANTSPFGDDKVEIIKSIYPKILDADKTYKLYTCLKFDSEKEKLEKFIREFEAQQPNTRVR